MVYWFVGGFVSFSVWYLLLVWLFHIVSFVGFGELCWLRFEFSVGVNSVVMYVFFCVVMCSSSRCLYGFDVGVICWYCGL